MVHTHYYNSNLIWRTVSRPVEKVIPLDHLRREGDPIVWPHLREVILYARSCYFYNMFIIYIFLTLFRFFNCFGL